MAFFEEFFNGVGYWYTSIKSRKKIRNKFFGDEIPFKKCVFLHLFNNEYIVISYFKKKSLPYEKGGDFLDGHCIIFYISFNLVMFHES